MSRHAYMYMAIALLVTAGTGCDGRKDSRGDKDAAMAERAPANTSDNAENNPQGTASANRLVHEDSPYLLQHAKNPVHWFAWNEEALRTAETLDRPIFLSIGYSACHWCHVMERESFANPEIAAILNRAFIAIKVDREERPDLDRIYMEAVQLMTGRGGWPMSVFLTPDRRPFYGGTYFPPESEPGRPGFRQVLLEIERMWRDERQKLVMSAAQVFRHLSDSDHVGVPDVSAVDWNLVERGTKQLQNTFDSQFGGFGKAPKFPPAGALELLLREFHRSGREDLLQMAEKTLNAMAQGGLFDQLGGGFHRYSVDERWRVPHFEKMLYDNALLARIYTDAFRLTGSPLYRQVAKQTLDFILEEMTDSSGRFYSAFDADQDGEEGAYYLWTPEQFCDILNQEDAALALRYFGLTGGPELAEKHVLHVAVAPERLAREAGIDRDMLEKRLEDIRKSLLEARRLRTPPRCDTKQLTSWNGLMISALTNAALTFSENRYLQAAEMAAESLIATAMHDDRLLHSTLNGRARHPGNADDYAYLAEALLDLYGSTGTLSYLVSARALTDTLVHEFWDMERGGFFYTPADRQFLISREKCFMDEALPSANAIAAKSLAILARLTQRTAYSCMAKQALLAAAPLACIYPGAFMYTFAATGFCLGIPLDITVTGGADAPDTRQLLQAIGQTYAPNAVLVRCDTACHTAAQAGNMVPMLRNQPSISGQATAYVCRAQTCLPPVTDPAALTTLLNTMQTNETKPGESQ